MMESSVPADHQSSEDQRQTSFTRSGLEDMRKLGSMVWMSHLDALLGCAIRDCLDSAIFKGCVLMITHQPTSYPFHNEL